MLRLMRSPVGFRCFSTVRVGGTERGGITAIVLTAAGVPHEFMLGESTCCPTASAAWGCQKLRFDLVEGGILACPGARVPGCSSVRW